MIWRIAVRFPTSSCKKIDPSLLLKGTDVHRTTVRRRLVQDFNLEAFKSAKKQPCLFVYVGYVYSPIGTRFNDCYTQATVKRPPSVMVMTWGAMSSNGTAGLFFLPIVTTNDVEYCKMLEDKLEIYMAIHECNMFIQDTATCQYSKLVGDFLKKTL